MATEPERCYHKKRRDTLCEAEAEEIFTIVGRRNASLINLRRLFGDKVSRLQLSSSLDAARKTMGLPPRTFSLKQRSYHQVQPPGWMKGGNDTRYVSQYRDNELLMTQGQIALAYLVQANRLLFEPGSEDSPADLVYSFDPFFEDRVGDLRAIAELLYGLKGKRRVSRDLEWFAEFVNNEYDVTFNQIVPSGRTRGRRVYYTSMMVHRKHLPEGRLISKWFPVLVSDETEGTMILPKKYWPESLVEQWKAG